MNIIGRLTRDAEVRNLPNEKQVVNFRIIAENLRIRNPDENVKVVITQNQNLKTAILKSRNSEIMYP